MTYPVMEHFYTLQGEGKHTGTAAYFIRLAGCDVGCHWCDVKDSWDAAIHPKYSVDELLSFIPSHAHHIIITGGEPAMYDLEMLISALHALGKKVHIETSGAYEIHKNIDWICVSPKKFKAPLSSSLSLAHELKIIVFNQSDFKWAEQHALEVSSTCELYLQPEWSVSESMNPLIVEYIQKNPRWKFSLQTHKYLNIP